ncbi:hypothetical protein GUITHDRAFT_55409, partial [Guillardia theta CCMP2712]
RPPRPCRACSSAMSKTPGGGEEEGQYHEVEYKGEKLRVKDGELLRSSLLRASLSPHNSLAQTINCRGLGTCGTCAVSIQGRVSPAEWTAMERARLNFPPYSNDNNSLLRLACQVRVQGDLKVTKFDKFWGQGKEETRDKKFTAPLGELEYILD